MENKDKKPIGRTPKFNVESVAKSVRVPLPSAEYYCAQIKKLVMDLAKDRGEIK